MYFLSERVIKYKEEELLKHGVAQVTNDNINIQFVWKQLSNQENILIKLEGGTCERFHDKYSKCHWNENSKYIKMVTFFKWTSFLFFLQKKFLKRLWTLCKC